MVKRLYESRLQRKVGKNRHRFAPVHFMDDMLINIRRALNAWDYGVVA